MNKTTKIAAWIAGLGAGVAALFGLAYTSGKSANAQPSGPKSVTVTTANSGQTVNLKVGDSIGVQLPGGTLAAGTSPGTTPWMDGSPPYALAGVLSNQTLNVVSTAAGNVTVYGYTASKPGQQTLIFTAFDPTTNLPTASFGLSVVVS